jgi:FAD/FMN-containing dehydrogenase
MFLDTLRSLVGDAHVLTDPQLKAGYETDWTRRFSGSALAVVRPGSVEEAAAVVRACVDAGVAIVPQGGNTGLVGGSVPRGGEMVLSLARMRFLEAVDPAAGEVTVEAGVPLGVLQSHVAAAGWAFGVDLGARDSATVGGMIGTNAGGIHVLRYGAMRRQVLGVEAVLADGSVVQRLSGLRKDNTGYDLAGLLCGSEGTLGIVTRARLALVPRMARRAVALLALGHPAPAIELVSRLRRSLPSLSAAELFFEAGLELVLRHAGAARPFARPHACYLLLEAGGASDPTDDLLAAVAEFPAADAVVASDPAGIDRLWQLRERHTESVNAEGIPHKLDITLPLARVAEAAELLQPAVEAAAPGARVILYGHVGDGNLHVNILGPEPDDEAADDAVLRLAIEMGGSISSEHGIGVAKVRWLEADRGPSDVAAMRSIKRALDPQNLLNPGVLFSA